MPTIPSIRTSIENKNALVLDSHAKRGSFLKDSRGRLISYAGGFSVVFPYESSDGKKWAFRCWHANIDDSKRRYNIISQVISKSHLDFLVDTEYIEKGISVEGTVYPTTRMRWVEGKRIKDYICDNRHSKQKLETLAQKFLEMTHELHRRELAHGDLQHGNILVGKDNNLYLVDYDSFYCPKLKGATDIIKGLADFQHPARKNNKLISEKLDYFSELIIYLSIRAIAENPTLIEKYQVEKSDRLLFKANDFINLSKSQIYKDIYSLGKEYQKLLGVLIHYLKFKNIDDLKPFEELLDKLPENSPEMEIIQKLKSEVKKLKNEVSSLNFSIYDLRDRNDVLSRQVKRYKRYLWTALIAAVVFILGLIIHSNLKSNRYRVISVQAYVRNEKNFEEQSQAYTLNYGDKITATLDDDGWAQIKSLNPFDHKYIRSELIVRPEEFEILEAVLDEDGRKELCNTRYCYRAIIDYFTYHEKKCGQWRVETNTLAQLRKEAEANTTEGSKYPDCAFIINNRLSKNRKKLVYYKFDYAQHPFFIYENETLDILKFSSSIRSIETNELSVIYPKFSSIDLVCGNMPSKTDTAILLVAEAAYTERNLNVLSHANIAGDHVAHGQRYEGYSCKNNTGAFLYYNGKWKFCLSDYSHELDSAAKNGGMAFAQELLIFNGTPLDAVRNERDINQYRALCNHNGQLCIVQSKINQNLRDFRTSLVNLGISDAIYLVGGASNFAWYRDNNSAIDMGAPTHSFCTNWITFYK